MKKVIKILAAIVAIVVVWNICGACYKEYYKAQLLLKYPLIQKIIDMKIPNGYNAGEHSGNRLPVLLKNGKLLYFGYGNSNIGLYDPIKNKFKLIEKSDFRFVSPYVLILSDDKALLISDSSFYDKTGKSPNAVGILNLKTQKFSYIGKLLSVRNDFSVTLLKNGKVLITGGNDLIEKNISLKSEIFDPNTGKSYFSGDTNYPEIEHSTLLLNDGNVLITGSRDCPDKVELYITKLGKFIKVKNIKEKYNLEKKDYHKVKVLSYLLSNNKVLILNSVPTSQQLSPYNNTNQSIYIYTPESKQFNHVVDLKTKFLSDYSLQGIQISDSKFIVMGFPSDTSFVCEPLSCNNLKCIRLSLELVDLETNTTKIIGYLPPIRYSRITLFNNNQILIFGGFNFGSSQNAFGFVLSDKSLNLK